VALEGGDHLFQPAGVRLGVIVQQRDEFPPRGLDPGVARAGEPPVLPQRQYLHLRIVAGQQFQRAVGGAVVGDDDFDVRVGLAPQALQAGGEMAGAVPVGDDDAD